jgi:hypothetical protein
MPLSALPDERQVYRHLVSVVFAAAAIIVSAYAFFLLQHILIIFPAGHLLSLSVAVEISLLVPLWMVLLWRYVRGESSILEPAAILVILWLAPQVTFIACVESEYGAVENDYADFAAGELNAGADISATAWKMSEKYLRTFSSSGNDIRNPVPVRSIFPGNGVYGFHLLLYHYLFETGGLEKLTVADGRGNCSEYATAVSFLVNKTLGIPSRFVIMYGCDHKFAEVKTGEGWLILDPLKTTPEGPVRAEDYARHLNNSNPPVYEQITGICSTDGESLLSVHGFGQVPG